MPAKPLPNTGAVSGLKETLDFFSDPSFAQRRFETYGDVFATKLLAQPIVFIRGERAISDLFSQSESLECEHDFALLSFIHFGIFFQIGLKTGEPFFA